LAKGSDGALESDPEARLTATAKHGGAMSIAVAAMQYGAVAIALPLNGLSRQETAFFGRRRGPSGRDNGYLTECASGGQGKMVLGG